MATKLLGVVHDEKYAKSVIKKLGQLKEGQTVALEIDPKGLMFFEKIFRSKKEYKRTKIYKYVEKVVWKAKGKKIGIDASGLLFFYKIFEHVKKSGGKCISLCTAYTSVRAAAEPTRFKRDLLNFIRARLFKKRIIKTKPDYALMGSSHVKIVQKC